MTSWRRPLCPGGACVQCAGPGATVPDYVVPCMCDHMVLCVSPRGQHLWVARGRVWVSEEEMYTSGKVCACRKAVATCLESNKGTEGKFVPVQGNGRPQEKEAELTRLKVSSRSRSDSLSVVSASCSFVCLLGQAHKCYPCPHMAPPGPARGACVLMLRMCVRQLVCV